MQNQNSQQNSQLKCDGCGQQFNNRTDLEKHRSNCSAVKSKSGSQPMTRGAGGSQNPQS